MRGVYLTFISTYDGQRKLIPRLEDHVILPELGESDVLVRVMACALSRIDVKTLLELNPHADQIPVGNEISGVIAKVGSTVTSFDINDEVCGILSLTSECPGCAEYCIVPDYCLVKKPQDISHTQCAAILRPALRAYTVLYYQARINENSTLLLFSAASAEGIAMINLCSALNIKVIGVVNNAEEAEKLFQLQPNIYKIVNLVSGRSITDICRHETGGLGVDCVIDNGVSSGYNLSDFAFDSNSLQQQLENESNRYEYETSQHITNPLPTKQDIINCLSPQGHWVTSQPDIQLVPPETKLLHMKSISLHFLFDSVWTLSGAQQGKYLHIVDDALKKLADGKLTSHVQQTISLSQVCEEFVKLGSQIGRIVMTTDTN